MMRWSCTAGALAALPERLGAFLPRRRCPVIRGVFQAGRAAAKENLVPRRWPWWRPYVNPHAPGSELARVWDLGYRRGWRAIHRDLRHARFARERSAR